MRFSNTFTNRFNSMTSLTWANVLTSCSIIIVLALIETCKRDGPIEKHVQSYSKQIVTNQTNYQKVVQESFLSRELTLIYFSQNVQCRHCICVVMPIALHTFLNEDILKCIEKTVWQVCIIGNACSMKQANSLIIIIIKCNLFIQPGKGIKKKYCY